MKYKLVWGFSEFFGYEETVIKESAQRNMLEEAQTLLSNMDDEEIMRLLEIDEEVISEGIYFRVK